MHLGISLKGPGGPCPASLHLSEAALQEVLDQHGVLIKGQEHSPRGSQLSMLHLSWAVLLKIFVDLKSGFL